MNALRKWFMVVAVLSMFALLLVGCSGGGGNSSPTPPPDSTTFGRAVSASNPVVGDWGTGITGGSGFALSFYPNGTYIEWNTGAGGTGVEYGTYTASPISGNTITITVTSILDDQGDTPVDPNANGLTDQTGQTKSIPITVVNQDTVQVVSGDGSTQTLHRVVDAGNPIVGSWGDGVTGGGTAANSVLLLVFYPNGTYILYGNDSNATCFPGVEYGTYTYNPATSTLTGTATVDQNGDQGFANGNGTGGTATVQINGDTFTAIPGNSAPSVVTISGVMLDSSGPGGIEVPVAGLSVVARHPADTNNSNAIATVTTGADGSFSMTVPSGSDLYLNVSGSSSGTQYASMNTRIWRNISASPDLSWKGECIFAVPLSVIDSVLNTVTCNGSPCSTTGIAGKGWLALDAFDAATMNNSIAGVSFLISPSINYFGYNDDTDGSTYLSSLSATVAGSVDRNGPMALVYNTTATIVTMTASKSGSANQTFELPIIPGELTYKQVGF